MNTPTASVVLFKTPEWQIDRLLNSIAQSTIRLKVFLIDNSPSALEYPCLHRPEITYIRAESNKGFGAGHNLALRTAVEDAEFHFILNPDVYFEPMELEKMIRFMSEDSTIGQLMPKVIYPDLSTQYLCKLLPKPSDLFLRRFSFGPFKRLAGKCAHEFELRFTNYESVMDVPFLSGCFMLLRTRALRKVGFFDEQFFLYGEDIDFSRRMHAQFRTVFFPDAIVVHDHARESYKSIRALRTHAWSLVKYFNKWGWIWDPQRSRINRETLRRLQCLQILQRESLSESGSPMSNTVEDNSSERYRDVKALPIRRTPRFAAEIRSPLRMSASREELPLVSDSDPPDRFDF